MTVVVGLLQIWGRPVFVRGPHFEGKAHAPVTVGVLRLNDELARDRDRLRVVPPERFLEEALELAAQIAERAPLAVRAAKKMISQAYERPLSDGLREERQTFYNLFDSEDQKEGMRAFIGKRAPQWKGI